MRFTLTPRAYTSVTFTQPHSRPGHGTNVTSRVHTATTRRSGSRTQDSGAGGGCSNKERQRLQPLASVARAPLFEVRGVRFTLTPRAYTSVTYIYIYIYIYNVPGYVCNPGSPRERDAASNARGTPSALSSSESYV